MSERSRLMDMACRNLCGRKVGFIRTSANELGFCSMKCEAEFHGEASECRCHRFEGVLIRCPQHKHVMDDAEFEAGIAKILEENNGS